ncbi:class I lanthipeptide [Haliangium sp.]|uniref:class I lanthipeptide n=1 Tax=Haliangium sp. TaxID=2663208 RepID=UPI003D10DFE7
MKKQRAPRKKLELSKQTLRRLDEVQLQVINCGEVQGITTLPLLCDTKYDPGT